MGCGLPDVSNAPAEPGTLVAVSDETRPSLSAFTVLRTSLSVASNHYFCLLQETYQIVFYRSFYRAIAVLMRTLNALTKTKLIVVPLGPTGTGRQTAFRHQHYSCIIVQFELSGAQCAYYAHCAPDSSNWTKCRKAHECPATFHKKC